MRVLLATAADEHFAPLLRDLIESLPQRAFADLAIFDLGLSRETLHWANARARHIVAPGWDLPVSERVRIAQPYHRALTVRPFLRDYFPGYQAYVWLDADCWIQEARALDHYFASVRRGALVIAPQSHPAYRHGERSRRWRADRLGAYFGTDAACPPKRAPYVNAGVFALLAKAPHWQAWRDSFKQGLAATDGELVCDQTALNHALWTQRLPLVPLPARFNWLCHLALPAYDPKRRCLCEPTTPNRSLGIVHLAAGTKDILALRYSSLHKARNG
ncbi:MAG TPA: hypothetical protein VIM98_08700 [Dyella sp.]|uniref:hypothetical protein n=1 Tax=Dyella sp. TaxID=1869338 RepID=UPI002F958309